MKAHVTEVGKVEIREASHKEASATVDYTFIPYMGKRGIPKSLFFTGRLWEKPGIPARLYLVSGHSESLGYWDTGRGTWKPETPRQEYLRPVIEAGAKAILEAIEAEKEKEERLREKAQGRACK